MTHVSISEFVITPEVWIRRQNEHTFTTMGYKWKYPRCDQLVELDRSRKPLVLHAVNVAKRRDYIVALVHGVTQAEEIPFALGTKFLCKYDSG